MLNYPIGAKMHIGDLFTISNNGLSVFSNIYDPSFELDAENKAFEKFEKEKFRSSTLTEKFESPLLSDESQDVWQKTKPKDATWKVSNQCKSTFESKSLNDQEVNANANFLTNRFESGGHFFTAKDVHYVRMPHLKEIYREIIRVLTTKVYALNGIFVITEIAVAEIMSYGVCTDNTGNIIVSIDEFRNGSFIDILQSDVPFKVSKIKGMDPAILRVPAGQIAFKAKKLQLTMKAREGIFKELINKENLEYIKEVSDEQLLKFMSGFEINASNVNDYFEWSDLTLNDVAHFFGS